MGIIKAAAGSVGGTLADQWLEIYVCESMPNDVLAMRGVRKKSERSSNTKGDSECISDGSLIIVNEGQCAISVDRGDVTGVYDKPGENVYHSERSKSIFHKGGIKGIVKQSWERFGYGGVAPVYQIIMFIDLKEHRDLLLNVTVPMRLKDRAHKTEMDMYVTVKGTFTFRIIDPLRFYQCVCGNAAGTVYVKDVRGQLEAEIAQSVGIGLARRCSSGAMSPADISVRAGEEFTDTVREVMTERWEKSRGIEITAVSISELNVDPKGMRMLQELERDKALTDPTMAAAHLVGAQASAMQSAAQNTSGAGVGVIAAVNAVQPPQPVTDTQTQAPTQWTCACGRVNDSKFCRDCGAKKP